MLLFKFPNMEKYIGAVMMAMLNVKSPTKATKYLTRQDQPKHFCNWTRPDPDIVFKCIPRLDPEYVDHLTGPDQN